MTKKPSPCHKLFFLALGKLVGFSPSSISQVTFLGRCHLFVFVCLLSPELFGSIFVLTYLKKLDFISVTFRLSRLQVNQVLRPSDVIPLSFAKFNPSPLKVNATVSLVIHFLVAFPLSNITTVAYSNVKFRCFVRKESFPTQTPICLSRRRLMFSSLNHRAVNTERRDRVVQRY